MNIKYLCKKAGVSSSGYYRWKKDGYHLKDESFEVELVTLIFESKKRKAGAKTIKMILERDFDIVMNLKKIRRIKKENDLVTLRRVKKYFNTFSKDEEHDSVPNLLNQDFKINEVDKVYSIDITYLDYGAGLRAYFFGVKDLCSKEIVHYSLSKNILLDPILEEFKVFLRHLPFKTRKNLIVHSDQGGHFTSKRFRVMLKELEIIQSMSRKGNCLDNAPIESFFGQMKDESEFKRSKRFEELEIEIKKFVNYYNNERPQWGLERKTPVEYRGLFL